MTMEILVVESCMKYHFFYLQKKKYFERNNFQFPNFGECTRLGVVRTIFDDFL